MEIELVRSSNQGVIVYVSDNCTEEYDLEQTLLLSTSAGEPGEPDSIFTEETGLPLRKRRAVESIQPKCYGWSDVLITDFERFVSVY